MPPTLQLLQYRCCCYRQCSIRSWKRNTWISVPRAIFNKNLIVRFFTNYKCILQNPYAIYNWCNWWKANNVNNFLLFKSLFYFSFLREDEKIHFTGTNGLILIYSKMQIEFLHRHKEHTRRKIHRSETAMNKEEYTYWATLISCNHFSLLVDMARVIFTWWIWFLVCDKKKSEGSKEEEITLGKQN